MIEATSIMLSHQLSGRALLIRSGLESTSWTHHIGGSVDAEADKCGPARSQPQTPVHLAVGLLILMPTVIVDAAADARNRDETRKLLGEADQFEAAKEKPMKICEGLDEDKLSEFT